MKGTFIPTILLLLISIDYSFAQNTFPSSGNVGIGTTSPIEPLEVNGNIIADGLISTRVPSNGNTWFQAATNGTLATGIGSNTSLTTNAYGAPANSSFVGNAQGYPLVFTTSAVEHMRITTGGNVGIGTTNPDQLLTVNGTIHSKEIKVDVNIVPDYVFEKKYKLKSLDEVQKYIKVNKHLPEISSAKNMEEHGLDVSDMNMILLKKVEELTLYLLDQKKQTALEIEKNIKQQKQITNMQNQINSINKLIIRK